MRLELLLAKIKREQPQSKLLLLTPFVENAKQIATWLGDGDKGVEITVSWRPSRLFLGLANVEGRGKNRKLRIAWKEPHFGKYSPEETKIPTALKAKDVNANNILLLLRREMQDLGTILGMYAGSKKKPRRQHIRLQKNARCQKNPTPRSALLLQ